MFAKHKLIHMILTGFVALTGLVLVPATYAGAIDPINDACTVDPNSPICRSRSEKLFGPNSIWTRIVNTMIFVVGAVAVVMIVVGGLKYTLSGGDASGVKGAKDTIIYAVVGLVIAVFAYSIVNFVLSRI